VISAVLCIALAHVLYYSAMRRIGATIPALVVLAEPIAVLAISHAIFGESLNILQLVFGAMLLIGAGLAIWSQQHLKLD
jgi:drug/metabolite transporter (DMT)-like permease